jgi:hypothetical protein
MNCVSPSLHQHAYFIVALIYNLSNLSVLPQIFDCISYTTMPCLCCLTVSFYSFTDGFKRVVVQFKSEISLIALTLCPLPCPWLAGQSQYLDIYSRMLALTRALLRCVRPPEAAKQPRHEVRVSTWLGELNASTR